MRASLFQWTRRRPFLNRFVGSRIHVAFQKWMMNSALQRWNHALRLANLAAFISIICGLLPYSGHRDGREAEFERREVLQIEYPSIKLSDLTERPLLRAARTPRIMAPRRTSAPALPPPPPKVPISEKAASLHLVGIVPGSPMQAIVEDAASQKTLYLTVGEMINDLKIEKILSDRVVLSCADEQMEIAL